MAPAEQDAWRFSRPNLEYSCIEATSKVKVASINLVNTTRQGEKVCGRSMAYNDVTLAMQSASGILNLTQYVAASTPSGTSCRYSRGTIMHTAWPALRAAAARAADGTMSPRLPKSTKRICMIGRPRRESRRTKVHMCGLANLRSSEKRDLAAIWELSRERSGGVRNRERGGSVGASRCDHVLKTRSRYAVRLSRLFRPAVPHST